MSNSLELGTNNFDFATLRTRFEKGQKNKKAEKKTLQILVEDFEGKKEKFEEMEKSALQNEQVRRCKTGKHLLGSKCGSHTPCYSASGLSVPSSTISSLWPSPTNAGASPKKTFLEELEQEFDAVMASPPMPGNLGNGKASPKIPQVEFADVQEQLNKDEVTSQVQYPEETGEVHRKFFRRDLTKKLKVAMTETDFAKQVSQDSAEQVSSQGGKVLSEGNQETINSGKENNSKKILNSGKESSQDLVSDKIVELTSEDAYNGENDSALLEIAEMMDAFCCDKDIEPSALKKLKSGKSVTFGASLDFEKSQAEANAKKAFKSQASMCFEKDSFRAAGLMRQCTSDRLMLEVAQVFKHKSVTEAEEMKKGASPGRKSSRKSRLSQGRKSSRKAGYRHMDTLSTVKRDPMCKFSQAHLNRMAKLENRKNVISQGEYIVYSGNEVTPGPGAYSVESTKAFGRKYVHASSARKPSAGENKENKNESPALKAAGEKALPSFMRPTKISKARAGRRTAVY